MTTIERTKLEERYNFIANLMNKAYDWYYACEKKLDYDEADYYWKIAKARSNELQGMHFLVNALGLNFVESPEDKHNYVLMPV